VEECFSQLLNVHKVRDVRQIEIYAAESTSPDPSSLEVEIAVRELKRNNSPGTVELNFWEIFHSEIHNLINHEAGCSNCRGMLL
jgi:hypothetical protein